MICSYEKCNATFEPKTHYQKYCSEECCRIATNLKIKQKYYDKKERLAGKKRICKVRGCQTQLSRYNPTGVCGPCEAKEQSKIRNGLISMVNDVAG